MSKSPSVELEAIIAHETVHIHRFGVCGWHSVFKYWTDKSFRLQEEIIAVQAEIAVYKKHHVPFDYESRAKSWSSINYGFMTTRAEATRILSVL